MDWDKDHICSKCEHSIGGTGSIGSWVQYSKLECMEQDFKDVTPSPILEPTTYCEQFKAMR